MTDTTQPTSPDPVPQPPVMEHHHRDISGGVQRAMVFGVSDGLVSNVSLILGMAGADSSAAVVRVAGIAGLIAGAVSMAAGEYVSMQAQKELLQRELEQERREHVRNPHVETAELAQIYASRGIDPDASREMAEHLMADPETALEAHAREELGIAPGSLGSPIRAALYSFLAFSIGALLPLFPWFFASGGAAKAASVVLGLVGASVVGALLARSTEQSYPKTIGRQVGIAAFAAGVTYLIGSLVGVGV